MDFKKKFGQRLREARLLAGLKQKELGAMVGVGEAAIAQYEAGSNTTPLERAAQLALALNVDLCWLCGLSHVSLPTAPSAHGSHPTSGG